MTRVAVRFESVMLPAVKARVVVMSVALVPVPMATLFAVVSKSKVRLSLLPADLAPVKVSTPSVADKPTPVDAPTYVVLESTIDAGRVVDRDGTPLPSVTSTELLADVNPAITFAEDEYSSWLAVVVVGYVAVV